jgi:hypothetical protein
MRDRYLIALAGITAVGALLRFSTLGVQSFWYDEAVTAGLLERSFAGMLDRIPDNESTPPLYYVAAWLWTQVLGTGEAAVRSLSALAGTAAIPAFYAAARELAGRRVAIAVAALAAVNPLLVWYSQEARAYALLTLLGALSLYFFARLLRRPDRRALVLWAVFSALALVTHYFAAFLVGPEAVWLALRARDRRRTLWAVGGVAALGLALLPLALHQRSLELTSFIRVASLPYRVVRTGKQYLLGFDSPLEVVLVVAAAAVAVAGLAAAAAHRRELDGARTAALLAFLVLAVPFLLALLGSDYFDTRNVILAWLPFAIVMVSGLLYGAGRVGLVAVGVLAACGLTSLVGVAVEPRWQRDNWRGAAKSVGSAAVPRAIVVTPGSGGLPFRHYRPGLRRLRPGEPVQEIALVSKPGERNETHPPLPPRPEYPWVAGFAELRRDYDETFTVIVFRASSPVRVTPEGLHRFRLLRESDTSASMVQDPPAVRAAGGARARRPVGG